MNPDKIFEVIGAYFANCYWNNLYALAQEYYKEGEFDNLIEAYKKTIEKYSKAFSSSGDESEINKHYIRIIKDIYLNYREVFKNTDTLLEFVDKVSKLIIPPDYYKTLLHHDSKKDIIFRNILIKSITRFTIFISQPEQLKLISDQQSRTNNVCLLEWKKKFMDFFELERNEFATLLLAQFNGVNIKQESSDRISKEVCEKLQSKVRELLEEKSGLIREVNNYIKYIGILKKIIREKEEIIDQQEKEIEDFQKKEKNKYIKKYVQENPPNIPTIPEPAIQIKYPEKALEELKNAELPRPEFKPLENISDNIQPLGELEGLKLDPDD